MSDYEIPTPTEPKDIRTTPSAVYYNVATGGVMYVSVRTNADKIRAKSDEELAEYFANGDCGYCKIYAYCSALGYAKDCEDVWLDWLKQEVK